MFTTGQITMAPNLIVGSMRLIAVENGVAPADLRFRRRLRIVIDPPKDSPAAPSAWQNAVRVLLTPRISEPRSLEISLLEESP